MAFPKGSFAVYPLTDFDALGQHTSFVSGLVVADVIDVQVFRQAIERVVEKWRLLAGRAEVRKSELGKRSRWQIKLPLGDLSQDYQAFALTTSELSDSVRDHISIPSNIISKQLPEQWFRSPHAPQSGLEWASSKIPLTLWHIAKFPDRGDGLHYTAVGLTVPHGVFDAVGVASIFQALESELQKREWDVPWLPDEGIDDNDMERAIESLSKNHKSLPSSDLAKDIPLLFIVTSWALFKIIVWHLWEYAWRRSSSITLVLPHNEILRLVNETREQASLNGYDMHLTTGDVLLAWLVKAIYSKGVHPKKFVHVASVASFRSKLPFSSPPNVSPPSTLTYPHNAFAPIPIPLLTVSFIRQTSLHDLACVLATARLSLSTGHVLATVQTVRNPLSSPFHPSEESLMVSNVSSTRLIETNLSTTPGQNTTTVFAHRSMRMTGGLPLSNLVFIAGKLADESVVVDLTLSRKKLENVKNAVHKFFVAWAR